MKKKTITYIEIESACNSYYVTTEDIMIILGGVSKSKADNFRKNLESVLDEEKALAKQESDEKKRNELLGKCFYFNDTRPHRLPVKRVLEYAHLDLDYIRREANKMRKAKRIEGEYEKSTQMQIENVG